MSDPRLNELREDGRAKYVLDDAGNVVDAKYADELVDAEPDALRSVLGAYISPGPSRKRHRAAKEKLHKEWPSLALSLDRLVDEELARRLNG